MRDMESVINGQPVEVDRGAVTFEACCDCSLIHAVVYEITDDGKIRVTKYRDDYATNEARDAEEKKRKRRRKA